ncbi:DUF1236 domain-containing protein [Neorhizobium sp. LjRoot104]|uniref:DUF1236 domain-containing protein n=1 Tax=Neorhizobium sp. LjRoot104 TaxID=3342254 RepID=UPI003ED11573
MRPSMKHALAIALLAGSTLSVAPGIAQSQAPAAGEDGKSGAPILPRKVVPGSDDSSGAMKAQPQQDMGAATQQPQGSTGGNTNAQAQSGDQQRQMPKGDSAAQEKSANPSKAQATQPRANDNTAQQKTTGQSDSSTTANSGSGSGTDARKPATDDTARQNNDTQQPGSNQAATTDKPSNETTGSINISSEQRTEVRKILVQNKVEPVDVDVEVNVGVAIPTTVELHPLPPRIVEIVPAYRGYEYFVLADGRIIIVEPSSHKIVYILVG